MIEKEEGKKKFTISFTIQVQQSTNYWTIINHGMSIFIFDLIQFDIDC